MLMCLTSGAMALQIPFSCLEKPDQALSQSASIDRVKLLEEGRVAAERMHLLYFPAGVEQNRTVSTGCLSFSVSCSWSAVMIST